MPIAAGIIDDEAALVAAGMIPSFALSADAELPDRIADEEMAVKEMLALTD
jgi:hypothetical protein